MAHSCSRGWEQRGENEVSGTRQDFSDYNFQRYPVQMGLEPITPRRGPSHFPSTQHVTHRTPYIQMRLSGVIPRSWRGAPHMRI